jgi:hypothetical protein
MCPVYFVTEEKSINLPEIVTNIKVGKCEWADRLLRAMDQIPEKNIIYMQEDHWFTRKVNAQELSIYYQAFKALSLDYLLMAPKNPIELGFTKIPPKEKFKGHVIPPGHNLFYCHWVSISDKNYFRKALREGETFHHNESRGRSRLRNYHARYKQIPRHVFYQVDWYSSVHRHAVRHTVPRGKQEAELLKNKAPRPGVFNEHGQKIMKELGLD